MSEVTQHSGAARATCPHSPPPPTCRDRGLQGEIYSGEPTLHHHPTAAIPSPNHPGLGTGIEDLPVSCRHTHSIPSQKLPKQSPQMIRPLPSTHRLLGLVLAVWLVWDIRRLEDSRGSTHPRPPDSHREIAGGGGVGGASQSQAPQLLQAFQELKHDQQKREARAPLLTVCIQCDCCLGQWEERKARFLSEPEVTG